MAQHYFTLPGVNTFLEKLKICHLNEYKVFIKLCFAKKNIQLLSILYIFLKNINSLSSAKLCNGRKNVDFEWRSFVG